MASWVIVLVAVKRYSRRGEYYPRTVCLNRDRWSPVAHPDGVEFRPRGCHVEQAIDRLFEHVHGLGFAVAILMALLGLATAKNDSWEEALSFWLAGR